jgi:RNA polymerase sigma-70 factor (ECF subfamily)
LACSRVFGIGEAGIEGLADEGKGQSDRWAAEREVVRRAQAGELEAFEQLYRENVRRVYALCYRLAGEAGLAEELAQEVFVRAWQKLASFRGESAFSSWLHTLTVNVALSERRTRRRRTARVLATEDPTVFERGEPTPRPELGVDLERALQELPPGARAVFVLHDVEGYRHDEIAQRIGVAVGTSKAQLHRARRLLREVMGR